MFCIVFRTSLCSVLLNVFMLYIFCCLVNFSSALVGNGFQSHRYISAATLKNLNSATTKIASSPLYFVGSVASADVTPNPSFLYGPGYVGDISFCLRATDTALSGPSRSKIMNEITNVALKAVLIGYKPAIENFLAQFPSLYRKIESSDCLDSEETKTLINKWNESDGTGDTCYLDLNSATALLNALEALLRSQIGTVTADTLKPPARVFPGNPNAALVARTIVQASVSRTKEVGAGAIYETAYLRVLSLLRESGWTVSDIDGDMTSPSSTIANTATTASNVDMIEIVPPVDADICLSQLDLRLPPTAQSRTRDLNRIANIVSRAMLYGGKTEKSFIARSIEGDISKFADTWTKGDLSSQEVLFLQSLIMLLRDGLTTTLSAITFKGVDLPKKDDGSVSATTSRSVPISIITPTAASSATPTTSSVIAIIPSPESPASPSLVGISDINGYVGDLLPPANSASRVIKPGPGSLLPAASLLAAGGSSSESFDGAPNLRLFDTYNNAFQRVVEACLTELGKKAESVQQNEEILLNLVTWEKDLRRDITDAFWVRNPTELAGDWQLMDVAGQGKLTSIMTGSDTGAVRTKKEVLIRFCRDGRVETELPDFSGGSWTFTPGPAHLDTCEFTMLSTSKSSTSSTSVSSAGDGSGGEAKGSRTGSKASDKNSMAGGGAELTLQYVGFIDRGQRIESRFSKSPLRMTGRVITMVKGEPKSSNRFIMLLRRDKKG